MKSEGKGPQVPRGIKRKKATKIFLTKKP